jgi:hypothetical protein
MGSDMPYHSIWRLNSHLGWRPLAVGFEFAEGGLYFPRKNGYEILPFSFVLEART